MNIDNELIAELIGGLMVPCSMGMLGAARKPYDELIQTIMGPRGLLGWPSKEEILKHINLKQQALKER